jgi:ribonuclease D
LITPSQPYIYIDNETSLEKLVEIIRKEDRVAVDTEADSFYHFHEKVCLIQLSMGDECFIVDPLNGLNLDNFFGVLSDKTLILHGSDYDLRMLETSFSFRPGQIFDTMIAAQIAGYKQFGLASLVDEFFNVKLSKEAQKSDWSARPLPHDLLVYASNDTRYLHDLADALAAKLTKLKRLDWHEQACRQALVSTYKKRVKKTSRAAWQIKGSSKLSARRLCYVHDIWNWRQEQANKQDLAPFRIMPNYMILKLANWAERDSEGKDFKFPPNFTKSQITSLLEVVNKSRSLSPSEWPEIRKRIKNEHPSNDLKYFNELREHCLETAELLDIDPSLLAPKAALQKVANRKLDTAGSIAKSTQLLSWQAEIVAKIVEKINANRDENV